VAQAVIPKIPLDFLVYYHLEFCPFVGCPLGALHVVDLISIGLYSMFFGEEINLR